MPKLYFYIGIWYKSNIPSFLVQDIPMNLKKQTSCSPVDFTMSWVSSPLHKNKCNIFAMPGLWYNECKWVDMFTEHRRRDLWKNSSVVMKRFIPGCIKQHIIIWKCWRGKRCGTGCGTDLLWKMGAVAGKRKVCGMDDANPCESLQKANADMVS